MPGQSLVAQWNEVMLDAIRAIQPDTEFKPTVISYYMYLTSSAVYDAWAAYDVAAYGYHGEIERPIAEHTEANKAAAVSYAAYRILSHFFPAQQDKFDAFMADLGYDTGVTATDPASAAGVGNLAAANVLAARANDGSNAADDFADTSGYVARNDADPEAPNAPGGDAFDPNHWQPQRVPTGTLTDANGVAIFDNDDPSTYADQDPLTPHWGSVTPFAMTSGDQFLPPSAPKLNDHSPYVDGEGHLTTRHQAYLDQFNEVLHVNANLTTEQKVIADFWSDGPGTESPPGHWNTIAQDVALREGHGIDEDAKLFFALNAAQFDAGIATWETKYHYDLVRPISAIRDLYYGHEIEAWGGPNQGKQVILGQNWHPYQEATFVTPPFPEFVSGHSTFSAAAAKTIAAFVGSDALYDGSSLSNYDLDNVPGLDRLGEAVINQLDTETFADAEPVVLRWETLSEAALEASFSRLYGGIHIKDGKLFGLKIGEQVAAQAQIRWEALFTRGGDDTIICEDTGGLAIAGAGNDHVQGAWAADIVEGGSGNDTVFGHAEDDELMGDGGADLLLGELGHDLLLGGARDDVQSGGEGNDAIAGEDGADQLIGGAGDDLVLGNAGADGISGEDGDDVLAGGAGADTISGGAANDIVLGEAGNDSLSGGAGDDHVFGGMEADTLIGDSGNDMLAGEAGNDHLSGGTGDDVLLGGDGVDMLTGGDGNDVLAGGGGADLLLGDAGADWFVFAAGEAGRDTVFGFDGSLDLVVLSGFGAGAGVELEQSAAGVSIAVGGTELALLVGVAAADLVEGANLVFSDVAIG